MHEPGAPLRRSARKSSLGFSTPSSPTLAHREDPHLLGRAEAVLAGAQDAEGVAAVALERQHHVDQVLEHARPGDRALLRHVAHEHERRPVALGRGRQQRRRLPHLRHRAGRRLDALGVQRLDRVDEHDRRPALAPRARPTPRRASPPAPAATRESRAGDRRAAAAARRSPPRSRIGWGRACVRTPRAAAPACSCRCRARRRAAPPSPARGHPPARGRARERPSRCAARRRPRSRARPAAWRRRLRTPRAAGRAPASPRSEPLLPPACSRHRTRGNGPASEAAGRRTPCRRRPSGNAPRPQCNAQPLSTTPVNAG